MAYANRKAVIYQHQYYNWLMECKRISDEDNALYIKLVSMFIVAMRDELAKQKRKTKFYKKKAHWVHPIYKLRPLHGFTNAIIPELSLDTIKFKNYMRTTPT